MKDESTLYELNQYPILKKWKGQPLWEVSDEYFADFEQNIVCIAKLSELKTNDCEPETPEGYFETLADKVLLQTNLREADTTVIFEDIPNGYFDTLADQVVYKMEEKELLPEILLQIPKNKESGAEKVYFEGFEQRLMHKIQAEKTTKPAKILAFSNRFGKRFRQIATGIAAVIVLGLGLNFFFQPQLNKKESSISFEQISDEGIIEYISQDESFDYNTLKEALPLKRVKPAENNSDTKFQDISDEELLEYLNTTEI